MAAVQVQAAKPQLSKARRAIQGTLHMTVGGWLSGPSTQILNAVSTASMTTLKIAKQPLSRVMSRIWYSGEGTPQDGLMKFASSQATAQLSGAWEGLLQTRQILRQSRIRQGFVTEAGRAKAQVEMNEAMAGERGYRHELNAKLVKPMLDQMDVHEKMDMDPYRPEEQRLMGGQMLSAGKAGVPVGWVHAAEDLNATLGAGVRIASNGYTGTTDAPLGTLKMNDVFWRTIMLRSSLRARATERAMADNAPGTLGREELIEGRIRDIEERSWDPGDRDHDLWSAAAKDAEEAAFVGEMPQWAEKLLASANASAAGSPRHLFPFVRSLTNVGVAGARHSIPGGEPAWRAMKGRMSQTERDRWDLLDAAAKAGERGEVAAGQVLSVVGGSLAWGLVANGIATGGNAQRDQLRRAKKDLDPEYSLKIGDTHYTRYAEMFGPVGMQTAMFADLYELQQVLRNEDDVDRFDTAVQAAINFSTVLAEQTPLGTGTEWAEEFSRIVFKEEPGEKMDAAGRLLQQEMKSRLVNVIPLSALRRKISEAASGGVRRTSRPDVEGVEDDGEILDYGWWKQTWSAVLREATRGNPFADSSLPPVRGLNRNADPLNYTPGDPNTLMGRTIGGFSALMSPVATIHDQTHDPAAREMARLGIGPDWTDSRFSDEKHEIRYSVPLSPEEVDTLSKHQIQMTFKELDKFVQAPWYKEKAVEDQKRYLTAAVNRAEENARKQTRRDHPALVVRLERAYGAEVERLAAQQRMADRQAQQGGVQ